MIFLIVFAVLVLIAGATYIGYLQRKKRREEMAALAADLGWRFDPDSNHTHDKQFSQFDIFRQGHSRYAYNTICGEVAIEGRQWPVQMGDFHYQVTTHNGKSSQTHTYRLSYVIVELPFLGLVDLVIRPAGMFDRVASFMGFDDIDFESAEFSDRFHVKSSDKKFAYDVCHPRMIEFLLAAAPPTLDIENRHCCLCDGRKTWKPEQLRQQLEFTKQFFALWPRHVTAMLEGDTEKYGP